MTSDRLPVAYEDIPKGRPLAADYYDKAGKLIIAKGSTIPFKSNGLAPAVLYCAENLINKEQQTIQKDIPLSTLNQKKRKFKNNLSLDKLSVIKDADKVVHNFDEYYAHLEKNNLIDRLELLHSKFSILLKYPKKTSEWAVKIFDFTCYYLDLIMEHGEQIQLALALKRIYDYSGYASWQAMTRCLYAVRVAEKWGADYDEKAILAAAALTCDIGMFCLADSLAKQTDGLTGTQKELIKNHSKISTDILKEAGVVNVYWLHLVENHHISFTKPVCEDSSDLTILSEILRLSDVIAARSSCRKDRIALPLMSAVANVVFDADTKKISYIGSFIASAIGLPPAGAIVEHQDGYLGVMLSPEKMILATTSDKVPRSSFSVKYVESISKLKPKPFSPEKAAHLRLIFERILNEYVA